MANDCIPFYEAGTRITGHATAAVTGKRFVAISGSRQADGSVSIAPPAAGGRVFGVAAFDAPLGGKTTVIRTPGTVVPVLAAGAIAAGAEVEVDATGAVVTKAAGVAVGYVITAAANGDDAQVSLY